MKNQFLAPVQPESSSRRRVHGNRGVKVYKMQAAAGSIQTATPMEETREETTDCSTVFLAGKSWKLLRARCNTAPTAGSGKRIGSISTTPAEGVDTRNISFIPSAALLLGMSCNSWIIWTK